MNTTIQPAGRRFYGLIGLAIAAIILLGFSRTYFLRAWFDVPPLTLRLHLHGAALTLWVLLFVVQTQLIAAGRRRLHMSLGLAGLGLAAVVIATSYAASIEAIRAGEIGVERLYSNVLLLTLFGLFVGLGAAFRKRPDLHRAFMILTMIAVVGPAVNRAVVIVTGHHPIRDPHLFVETALLLLALFHQWHTRRRLNWVLLIGGAVLIATQATRNLVGSSEAWAQIGNWLLH
jgi:hypothetical protein